MTNVTYHDSVIKYYSYACVILTRARADRICSFSVTKPPHGRLSIDILPLRCCKVKETTLNWKSCYQLARPDDDSWEREYIFFGKK
jgi:hypothetical protein